MSRTALYAGSFDPLTSGHLDILRQALMVFDCVVVAVGVHPGKQPMFSFEEREALIRESIETRLPAGAANVRIISFAGLAVEAARAEGAGVLVRGLRDGSDLDYEMQMAGMNGALAPDLVTAFLPASPDVRPITATLVRQIAAMGGDVTSFVPEVVATAIKQKFA